MSTAHTSYIRKVVFALSMGLLLASCTSYGPRSMDRDQLDYGNSVGENWKNQMLANIVKLRFMDMPVFVDVGSIVSGYSLSTTVSGRVGWGDSLTGGDSQGLGAGGTYTDRPTITYMPKTGNDYLKSILEPIEPKNLLGLIQAGYSAELLFTWAVEAINGVHNYSVAAAGPNVADPEFFEFVNLMEELQGLGAVGFELENDPKTQHEIIFVLGKEKLSESTRQKSHRAAEIIGLDENVSRYRVIYAPFKTSSKTLAIQTRSVIQMLSAMAGFVDIPSEVTSHTTPGYQVSGATQRPFHVQSSTEKPEESFAQVKYKGHWYWIENSDLISKRVFTLMLFITTLTNQANDSRSPVLTIPTG